MKGMKRMTDEIWKTKLIVMILLCFMVPDFDVGRQQQAPVFAAPHRPDAARRDRLDKNGVPVRGADEGRFHAARGQDSADESKRYKAIDLPESRRRRPCVADKVTPLDDHRPTRLTTRGSLSS
jgi:hypothetical protein